MPEIVQEIGAYAGLAAVAGLAVLSVLYFSQARDVKRLREWAGRAPERAAEAGVPAQPALGRVQAQPQAKPGQAAVAPGVPQPGAAKPGAPGAAKPGQPQPPKPGQPGPQPGKPQPAPAGGQPGQGDGPGHPQPAKPDQPQPAKPGQPQAGEPQPAARLGVPAVAAAAAGAAPASATQTKPPQAGQAGAGPATPAGGRPPGAPPPVPPGQRAPVRPMLPPRPMPQQTAIIPPPRQPWYRRLLGSPRYLVLVVAGVLILGGAAAAGITQLSSGDDATPAGNQPAANGGGDGEVQDENGQPATRRVVPGNVTVAVLNGTTVPGLAQTVSDDVQGHGFQVGTVANTPDQDQQRAESVVLYAPGHKREATAVSRRLNIGQRQQIDPASQELAGDATVVVIAGADRAP